MKISVLVIAHNEEKYISKCLDSILHQTLKPDEVIVVAHNCTDATEDIVKNYIGVRLVSFHGEPGVAHARIKGFEEVTGEIVACIDGDAYAEHEWLNKVISPLENPNISAVGTVVVYTGSVFSRLSSFKSFYLKRVFEWALGKYGKFYFFGPSFAVRKKDYEDIGGLKPFLHLRKKLPLINWPDDAYLGLALWQKGRVVLVKEANTKVFAKAKNLGFYGIFIRPIEQMIDGRKLYNYFNNNYS